VGRVRKGRLGAQRRKRPRCPTMPTMRVGDDFRRTFYIWGSCTTSGTHFNTRTGATKQASTFYWLRMIDWLSFGDVAPLDSEAPCSSCTELARAIVKG